MTTKALFLTDGLENGGAERQLALLVKYLPPEWERQVWSLGDGPYAAELRKAGVRVHLSPRRWRWDIFQALSLWRLVWNWGPDIIHSYGYMGTLAALLPCKCLRIPLVDGTIRNAHASQKRAGIARWASRWGDRVIANSKAGLKAGRIDPGRGRVIYNGFDPARLKLCVPEIREGNPARPFRVVMVARMHPMKDYDSFIRAVRHLVADEQDAWEFLAVGSGPLRASLMAGAADLIARNAMDFPEGGIEVLPYVRQADVGVLLTVPTMAQEGCSNAIMEYMACGLPVICSESGGNRELVVDGVTGFVVPPQDMDAVVEKLLWLRNNPQAAHAMGAAGRQRLLDEFTVEKLVEKTLAVYAELLPTAKTPKGKVL